MMLGPKTADIEHRAEVLFSRPVAAVASAETGIKSNVPRPTCSS
jgi:hypothetical protein